MDCSIKIFSVLFLLHFLLIQGNAQKPIISNLQFKGCFSGNVEQKNVVELQVSFCIQEADVLDFIYLYYEDKFPSDSERAFKLLRVADEIGKNIFIEEADSSYRVKVLIDDIENMKDVKYIRLCISDLEGRYSNNLIFRD